MLHAVQYFEMEKFNISKTFLLFFAPHLHCKYSKEIMRSGQTFLFKGNISLFFHKEKYIKCIHKYLCLILLSDLRTTRKAAVHLQFKIIQNNTQFRQIAMNIDLIVY